MLARFRENLPQVGAFSAIPAGMIDRAYLDDPRSYIGKAWQFIKVRSIYLGLFLPAAAIDMVSAGALAMRYSAGVMFRSDEVQKKRNDNQLKYATLFSKNLYALNPVSILAGFGSPKLVEFYFHPERRVKGVVSGGGYYKSPDVRVAYPESVQDIQDIVTAAAKNGDAVIAVGAGRSQGKQFIPENAYGKPGIMVDLSNFDGIKINPEKKTARIGAGVRWADVQQAADKHKLALKVMQASNVFSAGGSLGTNIHGWDHRTGVLSNSVLEMTIINAQGEEQTLTPDDDLFHLVTGGHGLFGIVTSMKIQLTDNELLYERGTEVPLGEYVQHFYRHVMINPNIRMHLFRLSLDPKNLLRSGVAADYVKEDDRPACRTENLTQEGAQGSRFNRVMVNFARRYGWMRDKYWESERKRLLANNSVPMTNNAIMQPPINAMFNASISEAEWLQEYFLPGEKLETFLYELGQLLMDNDVALINASVRFVKQHSRSPMSYAHDGDRFAVVLCFNQPLQESAVLKARRWLIKAQEITVRHGGSYYLPYQHVSDPVHFAQSYPHADIVRRCKKELDPNGVFSSGFYQKYLAPKPAHRNYFDAMKIDEAKDSPEKIRKTREFRKAFEGFLNNVLQRVEPRTLYALMDDVLKYTHTHRETYVELCRRLPEIMPGLVSTGRRILGSLSTIKQDLGAQAKLMLRGTTEINGLVEIGYPGRFIAGFRNHFRVTGNIVAVYEGPSLGDYIQTGYPHPYHQFHKLDYFNPELKEKDLPSNSADLITCYVGLHHFPEDKLESFLTDVRRILRPGGHFLLVDHDVNDEQSMVMAHMAHIIFNAVTGESVENEMREIRLFRSMAYWRSLLEIHGLAYTVHGANVPMIRDGDPSMNRMVCFTNTKLRMENVLRVVEAPEASAHASARQSARAAVQQALPRSRSTEDLVSVSTAQVSTARSVLFASQDGSEATLAARAAQEEARRAQPGK